MKKIKIKLLDFYFNHPFIVDTLLISGMILMLFKFRLEIPALEDKTKIDSFISNITSSIVALAGFILASLTIIVTVKSNIKIRNLEDAQNSTELLLTSANYKNIVTVFRDAIIELVFGLIAIYILWMPIFQHTDFFYILLIVFGVAIILLTLIRSLLVLFKIIFMEFQ
ncbi:MAG: hypothetical protein IPK31_15080 [Chitinophagaceae bacterium]|nr:hypothetical protein [Chitinophagaceae bacterium]